MGSNSPSMRQLEKPTSEPAVAMDVVPIERLSSDDQRLTLDAINQGNPLQPSRKSKEYRRWAPEAKAGMLAEALTPGGNVSAPARVVGASPSGSKADAGLSQIDASAHLLPLET
ncbi:MAG: hypothetical protein E5Y31_30525, partial [Mesorhizobium sp.]